MDAGELLGLLLYLVIVAGALATLWFFQVRRLMIQRMKRIVEILEEELRPRDKTYTLLGYLVGFRAVYERPRVRGVGRAWILYTQPPRHVLFYLPVSRAIRARERLELTFRTPYLPRGEAHLYAPWDRASARLVGRDASGEASVEETVEIAGRSYRLLSDGAPGARSAVIELASLLASSGVYPLRVTIDSRRQALHVAIEPRLETLREALRRIAGYASRLAGERSR